MTCIVTKSLFSKFEKVLTSIYPEKLEEKEMFLGIETDTKEQKHHKNLRNLITFTIRSIVHRNKWTNFSVMNKDKS